VSPALQSNQLCVDKFAAAVEAHLAPGTSLHVRTAPLPALSLLMKSPLCVEWVSASRTEVLPPLLSLLRQCRQLVAVALSSAAAAAAAGAIVASASSDMDTGAVVDLLLLSLTEGCRRSSDLVEALVDSGGLLYLLQLLLPLPVPSETREGACADGVTESLAEASAALLCVCAQDEEQGGRFQAIVSALLSPVLSSALTQPSKVWCCVCTLTSWPPRLPAASATCPFVHILMFVSSLCLLSLVTM
jgi:hypothetical protein